MTGPMSLADENFEVLEGIAARGTDLSVPRLIDFAHVFFSEPEALRFKDAAEKAGYQASMQKVESEELWDVIASSKIVPSFDDVTRLEEELDCLARSFGGQADGWGFLEG